MRGAGTGSSAPPGPAHEETCCCLLPRASDMGEGWQTLRGRPPDVPRIKGPVTHEVEEGGARLHGVCRGGAGGGRWGGGAVGTQQKKSRQTGGCSVGRAGRLESRQPRGTAAPTPWSAHLAQCRCACPLPLGSRAPTCGPKPTGHPCQAWGPGRSIACRVCCHACRPYRQPVSHPMPQQAAQGFRAGQPPTSAF